MALSSKSTDMRLSSEFNPWPDGVWLGLDLEVNLDFDLYQIKSISFDAAWWEDYDGAVFMALQTLLAELSKKSKPDFWVNGLTFEVTDWFVSAVLLPAKPIL